MSVETQVEVHFHGSLRQLSPPVTLSGHTMSEILSGLKRMFPTLAKPHTQGGKLLKVNGFDNQEAFFNLLPGGKIRVDIVPALFGGKNGGFLNIILGTVLIATAFLLPPAAAGFALFGGTTVGSMMFGLGVSLVLGGLLSLLSPAPSLGGSGGDQESSKYINSSGTNTTKIGTRIALLYGKHRAFGHYLSINVDAVDVAT